MDTELPKGSDVWPSKTLVPIDEAWALVVELYDRFGDTPYHLQVVPDLLMDAFSALDDHHAQKSAFIVKAVNHHQTLVDALSNIVRVAGDPMVERRVISTLAQNALAAVEAQP